MTQITPEEAALTFVNEIRATQDLKPLKKLKKGTRRDSSCCPIANSVRKGNTYVSATCLHVGIGPRARPGTYRHYRVPGTVALFMRAFDHGSYPQLVA